MTKPHPASSRYAANLLAANVRCPLAISNQHPATIIDAEGRDVLTITTNDERSRVEAIAIAAWIIVGVNVCAGFEDHIPTFPDLVAARGLTPPTH